ncbi:hypothetical protein [Aquimarina megaterium]|uniref:hypothetical protein n=1 Tax=Aquimarina megaterium TaxID=1443666 RepID=UPI0004B3C24E|nr:hypothetical protein [Aquimarina megaterium]
MFGIQKDVTDNFKHNYLKNQQFIHQSKKTEIMRTIDSNRITRKLNAPIGYTWNSKRRYR